MKNLRITRNKGFTLLEILVVISIIGILIAIGSAAFSTAQKKGRDARRRADMKQFQNAFEQYYSENGSYGTCTAMEAGFTGAAPTDPKPSQSYNCTDNFPTGTLYCVCATLDDTTGGNGTGGAGGTCTFSAGGTDFCVQSLQ